jgi:TetR/AcrR family transcriptional regulator of autoinduction and epiphytic fitness
MEHTNRTRIPRHAAGENPDKRAAIIEGAAQVFLQAGFDAASVNDICAAAGVSKSTLYVYFSGKEDLFETLVEEKRELLFQGLHDSLRGPAPLAARLGAFARAMAHIVCSDEVIGAQRIVIGVAERRPDIGIRYYEAGAEKGHAVLLGALHEEIAAGSLQIPDPALAAYQFVELAAAGHWRRRLFGKAAKAPPPEEIAATAESAVTVFLAAYGKNI